MLIYGPLKESSSTALQNCVSEGGTVLQVAFEMLSPLGLIESPIYDASSNSGDLPDLDSPQNPVDKQEKGDLKRHREKVLYISCRASKRQLEFGGP